MKEMLLFVAAQIFKRTNYPVWHCQIAQKI